ncbi:MAG: hypothetical protein IJI98_00665 [Methanosphaera sp.]|nr:hypothetical protein [Methanosphaera sp.]
MDIVTYALLKKKIDDVVSGYVTDEEMAEAISLAVQNLVTTEQMTVAIDNAVGAIIAGFSYKGTVATISALPSSGNTKGDCYTVDENLGTYVWDGNKWFEYNVNLDLILQSGTEETAKYHLGFYIDSDGDVAQIDN